MNATVYKTYRGVVTVAEESTAFPGVTRPTSVGGLGFGFKWNMGWMHDTLTYIAREPVYRQWHHQQMTFAGVYAWSENYVLPLSHDEVVHGKRSLAGKIPGDTWQRLATLRALYAFMWAFPGKKLLFMGGELGDDREWSEAAGIPWGLADDPARAGIQSLVRDLNAAYRGFAELWSRDTTPDGFAWIEADDAPRNTYAFLRYGDYTEPLACVVNFAPVPHDGYLLGLPCGGTWREVINTDAHVYGGSGVGNLGTVEASDRAPAHGQPASALLRVPPLGALWLRPA
jgi:1,4-alpha-glucan branching enzyme